MSDWESRRKIDLETFAPLKLLLEKKAIRRLFDLRDLHSGKIAIALGINRGRYAEKLASPEKFTVFEVLRFAYLIDVDPFVIMELIQNDQEVLSRVQDKVQFHLDKIKMENTK